jgi:ankyrin repeat protein
MPTETDKLTRADFNKLVDALMRGTTTLDAESRRDNRVHLRRGVHDETLLHFFAVESKPDLVRGLAALGSDVNTENEFGNTPLVEAVIKSDLPMVQLLLELGADPNRPSSRDQNTALHVAADYERQELVRLLLRSGASTEPKNKYAETPADLIAKNRLAS